ncbi:hypothetical protein [Nannocystis pusilla]|uniref:hypothetical protein n=1 Tax=Nannocystis pusilla TaxID=889268 RepID=UPI003B80C4EC
MLLCSDGLHEYLDSADTLTDLFQLDARDAAPAAVATPTPAAARTTSPPFSSRSSTAPPALTSRADRSRGPLSRPASSAQRQTCS